MANLRTLTIFLLSKIVYLPFFRKLFLRAWFVYCSGIKKICWSSLNWLLQISALWEVVNLPFHRLFRYLCSDILIYFYGNHDFLELTTVPFVTRQHRILLNSGKSGKTLGPKQKRKMMEIWKKENGHLHDFFSSTLPK